MKKHLSSIAVIVLMAAFLYTGKTILSKRTEPESQQVSEQSEEQNEAPSDESSSEPILTTTSVVQTTVPEVSQSTVVQTTATQTQASVQTTAVATTFSVQVTVVQTAPVEVSTTAAQTQTVPPPVVTTVQPQQTEAKPVTTIQQNDQLVTPTGFSVAPEGYFNDALFIGDSRTVGMRDYAPISGADYFASVGMNVYNIKKQSNPVKGRGNLNFQATITGKQYGKVYIMLGINEIGYNRTTTLKNYQNILNEIRAAQPNAIIYIEANLHVAAKRSNTDKLINNTNINTFNQQIAAFADGQTIFYLDINTIFDDENGNLRSDYTHDNTHVLAKYYIPWNEWLTNNVIVR